MVMKYIHSTFLVVVIVFSEVYGRKIKSNTTPDITEIVKNASKVNNLLQNVIKNYKKLEKIETSGSEETDRKTDKEANESFDKDTNKRGRSEDKITSTSEKPVRLPMIYFSDKSSREEESENGDRETANEKHDFKSMDSVTTKSNKSIKRPKSQKDKAKKHAKIIEKLLKQETKRMKDDISLKEDKVTKTIKAKKRVKITEKHSEEETEPIRADDLSDEKSIMSTPSPRVNKVRGSHKKNKDMIQDTTSRSNQVKTRSLKSKPKTVSPVDKKVLEPVRPVVHEAKFENEEAMQHEVSRAEYLREAYLDACKVVIIRKCRRALRAVSKDVCSRNRKCSGNFKDEFRTNGMNACDKQFTNQNTACRSGIEEGTKARRIFTGVISSKEPETNSSIVNKKTHKMNILRDRYEKACKKDSFKKCRAACKEASTKTCKKYECTDLKANAFRKACRRRCIETFQVTGEDADSDGDDDYDDDDDDKDDKK